MEIIFRELDGNPDMDVDEFIELLRKYSSTILLTEKEHRDVTIYTRNSGVMNYMVYGEIGIKIKGLSEIIDSTHAFV
jgi:AmiR/NasT family two-component response regulator